MSGTRILMHPRHAFTMIKQISTCKTQGSSFTNLYSSKQFHWNQWDYSHM